MRIDIECFIFLCGLQQESNLWMKSNNASFFLNFRCIISLCTAFVATCNSPTALFLE